MKAVSCNVLGANTKQTCVSLLAWEHNLYHALNLRTISRGQVRRNVANPLPSCLEYFFQTLVWFHTKLWEHGPLQALIFCGQKTCSKISACDAICQKEWNYRNWGAMWRVSWPQDQTESWQDRIEDVLTRNIHWPSTRRANILSNRCRAQW